MEEYTADYPKKPVGVGNPYWCCVYRGITDPQINGKISGYSASCKWRVAEENKSKHPNTQAETSERSDNSHPATCSASLTVQHERWAADRWKVMLRVNGTAFMIGAECDTRESADRLKADFASALNALGVNMPNT